MRLLFLAAMAGLLAAGCSDSATAPPSSTSEKHAWVASFSGAGGDGNLVLDLVETGSSLAGEVALGPLGTDHFWVVGTMQSDSIVLADDPAHPPAQGFSLRARVSTNGDLSGDLGVSSIGLDADVIGRALARRQLSIDMTRTLSQAVTALAYDGQLIWLSTSGDDYPRVDVQGTIVDTITIFHRPGYHWTSSPVMFDGTNMWGVYPITLSGPGGSTNVADLLAFNEAGRTPDSLRLGHRPLGLAHDGVHPWSLRSDPPALLRFDGLGAVTDSLSLAVPDAFGLGFDGTHFWTIGWFLRRLYEIDSAGNVVAIADLPSAPGRFASGLTFDPSHLWYADAYPGGATTLYRMSIR